MINPIKYFLLIFLLLWELLPAKTSANFNVLQQNSTTILLEWNSPELQWEYVEIDGKQFTLPILGDLPLLQIEGYPQLPIDNFLIENAADIEITILDSVWTKKNSGRICPSPTWRFNRSDSLLDTYYEPNSQIYNSKKVFPQSFVSVQKGGKQFARLGISPLKFSPPNQVQMLKYLKIAVNKKPVLPNSLKKNSTALIDFENSVKLLSAKEGVFSVTGKDLQNAGVNLFDVQPEKIKLLHLGIEQPCAVEAGTDGTFDEDDRVYYFARRLTGDSSYYHSHSDTNVYWLNWAGENGKRFQPVESFAVEDSIIKFLSHTIHLEEDKEYYYGDSDADIHETMDVPGEGWVWNKSMFPESLFRTFFDVPGLFPGSVKMRVRLRGSTLSPTSPDHHVQFRLNDTQVFETFFDDTEQVIPEFEIDFGLLKERENKFEIYSAGIAGNDFSKFYIDWIEVDYLSKLVPEENYILFTSANGKEENYSASGFTSDSIAIWDMNAGVEIIPQNIDNRKEIRVKVESAGFSDGNFAYFYLDNEIVFFGKRGINLVTLNGQTGEIRETKSFDTYSSIEQADSLALFLKNLSDGTMVIAAVRDEGSAKLDDAARQALKSIGSALIDSLGGRDSWAIIGKKGAPVGSVPEQFLRTGEGSVALQKEFVFAEGSSTFTVDFSGNFDDVVVFDKNNLSKPKLLIPQTKSYPVNSGADYIIITHPDFYAAAQALADYRTTHNGFRTFITTPQEIYDRYSFGITEPIAIQQFLKEAFDSRQAPAPRFVLLLGDASWDPKQNLPNADKIDFVPTIGNPVSDALFVCFDGPEDILPDMSIGRLPVETVKQAEDIVQKIITYEQTPSAAWKKKFLFINGGFDRFEQSRFRQQSQLLVNEFIVVPPTSGSVQILNKESQGYEEGENRNEIIDAFNKGLMWVNFIGHAGSRTWDLMFHNPDIEDLSNGPELPVITSMTCHTGRFAEPNQTSFGENFLLVPENGAIAFWGTSGWGYTYEDYMYLRRLFPAVFQDTVHTIGDAITSAKFEMWKSFGSEGHIRDLILQYNLLGDPALELALPNQPDLALTPSSISTNPVVPSEADSTAIVKIKVENYGLATSDSVEIAAVVTHSENGSILLEPHKKFPAIGLRDSLELKWPLENMSGLVNLESFIDPNDLIAEADEMNNRQTLAVNVLSNVIKISSPRRDAMLPKDNIVLKIQNPQTEELNSGQVEFQVDTTSEFNSGFLQNSEPITLGKVATSWEVADLLPNQLYYWRVKMIDPNSDPVWSDSHFMTSPENYGWKQSFGAQFIENKLSGIELNTDSAYLASKEIDIYVESAGYSDGNFARIIVDNKGYIDPSRGVNVVVFDPIRATVDTSVIFDTYADSSAGKRLAGFIQSLKTGKYVFAAIKDEGSRFLAPAIPGLESIGSRFAQSIGSRDSWAIIGQKGAVPGSVPEQWRRSGEGASVVNDTLSLLQSKGSMQTHSIGPARQWHDFNYSTEIPDETSVTVYLYGKNTQTSVVDTLFKSGENQANFDLTTIDPKLYPFLSVRGVLKTDHRHVTPVINEWSISYQPVPDLAITPFVFMQEQDSVLVGEKVELQLKVFNIGEYPANNFSVNFYESGTTNGQVLFASEKITLPVPVDSFHAITTNWFSEGKTGLQKIFVQVDPENSVIELDENNNTLTSTLFVRADSTSPELEITFDGQIINYGELVATAPKILVRILDNSPVLIADTSQVQVHLDGKQVNFSEGSVLNLQSDKSNQKTFVEFYPELEDGNHLLEVFVSDASQNRAYQRVDFRVVSELQVMNVLNYPNPMKLETDFTFTLTQPADVELKIYTVAGRLIRRISLGTCSPGYNVHHWDGLDGDGDYPANGVYLYNVIAISGNERTEAGSKIIIMR